MPLLAVLVVIIIMGVVFWAARALIAAFQIPDPIATVIYVVIVILCLFIVLGWLGIGPGVNLKLSTK